MFRRTSPATITWTTDEDSDSVVRFGTAVPPTSEAADTTMVTSHSVSLTDLTAEITYYYEVQSTDGSGNTAVDDNGGLYYSFTTEAAARNDDILKSLLYRKFTVQYFTSLMHKY